jgi:hypothetical protein
VVQAYDRALLGVLVRVGEQVGEHLGDPVGIRVDLEDLSTLTVSC